MLKEKNSQTTFPDDYELDPESANFEKFALGFGMIGVILGCLVDLRYFQNDLYTEWNDTSLSISILRYLAVSVGTIPFSLPMFLVNKENQPYWVCLVLKSLGPGLILFYLFGFGRQVAIKLGLANTSVKSKTHYVLMKYMNDGHDDETGGENTDYSKIDEIETKALSSEVT